MFSLPRTLTLEGQKFTFNPNSNTVILEITQPFMSAGKKLGWDTLEYGVPGLGINRSIVNFVLTRKSHIVITVLSQEKDVKHWMQFNVLRDFIKNNRTQYPVSGKIINVIPWKLFSPNPTQEASS